MCCRAGNRQVGVRYYRQTRELSDGAIARRLKSPAIRFCMSRETQKNHRPKDTGGDRDPAPDFLAGEADVSDTTVLDDGEDLLGASRSSIDFEGPTTDITDDDPDFGLFSPGAIQDLNQMATDFSRYRTFARLGAGGVGSVASCFDPSLGRYVALKKLHSHLKTKDSERARFLREARVMAQIEHPHIVPVHEMGVTNDGTPYFTMKKVRGNSLAEVLAELRDGNPEMQKRYTLRYLIDVFVHVAQAVAFAHSRGIIHRDLKPSNVLIGEFGEVLVVDWGLAKIVGARGEDEEKDPEQVDSGARKAELDRMGRESVTIEGVVSGTPAYMAPEQAMGKVSELNGQTDIYSLGAILYEMLTLRRMIHGDTVRDALKNVIQGSVIPPRKRAPERRVPKDLEAICLRATARRPEDRYESVKAMLQDIYNYENDFPVAARRGALPSTVLKWGRRNRGLSTTVASAITVVLLTFGILGLARETRYQTLIGEADGHMAEGVELYEDMRRAHMALMQFRDDNKTRRKEAEELQLERNLRDLESRTDNELKMALVLYERAANLRASNHIRQKVLNIVTRQLGYELLGQDYAAARQSLAFARKFLGNDFEKLSPQERERLLVFDEMARGMGVLTILTPQERGRYSLVKLEASPDGVMTEGPPIPLQAGGKIEITMPVGSYIVKAQEGTGESFSYPVRLRASRRRDLHAVLPGQVPEGMVFVPGGPFLCGGVYSRYYREHAAELPSFWISATEVTFAEYLEFWLTVDEPAERDKLRARVRFDPDVMAFTNAWDDRGQLISQFSPDMPVVGISHSAATAYCQWLSEQQGRTIRLPTAGEWEKAARGVDGREFPWGDIFLPDRALTSENRRGKVEYPLFAPVGSFPGDKSVYGAMDMAGNAREWTSSILEAGSRFFQIKGSSASLTRQFAACSYSSYTPVIPTDVGFRYLMPHPAGD